MHFIWNGLGNEDFLIFRTTVLADVVVDSETKIGIANKNDNCIINLKR